MTAEVYFAGSRLETVFPISGVWSNITNTAHFEAAYSDAAIHLASGVHGFYTPLYTETTGGLSETTHTTGKLYVHFVHRTGPRGSGTNNYHTFLLRDNNDYPWLRLWGSNGTTFSLSHNTGTGIAPVWTTPYTFTLVNAVLETYDIEFEIGSPHTYTFFRNGTPAFSGSFTNAGLTEIKTVLFGQGGDSLVSFSQIIITNDIPTPGAKLKTARPTAAGANTGWSNTFASVNEPAGSDATVQNAATTGLVSTHQMTDVTVPVGFEIKSVFNWMRAKNDGAAPTNIKSVLRVGGTDYATDNLPNMGVGYRPIGARYNDKPGGGNWTESDWNSTEAGYESGT